jgi:aminoglycoside phosphotransferase family enzyme
MSTRQHDIAISAEDIGIDEKVDALMHARCYPYVPRDIAARETHMSWVFLADDLVYKLKKPVRYDLLDHTSLESRRINSEEEVRINRVLGGDIYLGVVPLVIDPELGLRLEGKGPVVDWLVKMKRIPDDAMLDQVIRHNRVDEQRLQQAADLLARFYTLAPASGITGEEYLHQLHAQVSYNIEHLTNPLFDMPVDLVHQLTAGQYSFLEANAALFEQRTRENRIVEAHGDLRPEHICLTDPPVIIDRLEFNPALRMMDIAEELSFLAMECDKLGNSHVARVFINQYSSLANDTIPRSLVLFYKIKRACLRAYLVARHMEEKRYQQDPKWLKNARVYLEMAERYHQELAG